MSPEEFEALKPGDVIRRCGTDGTTDGTILVVGPDRSHDRRYYSTVRDVGGVSVCLGCAKIGTIDEFCAALCAVPGLYEAVREESLGSAMFGGDKIVGPFAWRPRSSEPTPQRKEGDADAEARPVRTATVDTETPPARVTGGAYERLADLKPGIDTLLRLLNVQCSAVVDASSDHIIFIWLDFPGHKIVGARPTEHSDLEILRWVEESVEVARKEVGTKMLERKTKREQLVTEK